MFSMAGKVKLPALASIMHAWKKAAPPAPPPALDEVNPHLVIGIICFLFILLPVAIACWHMGEDCRSCQPRKKHPSRTIAAEEDDNGEEEVVRRLYRELLPDALGVAKTSSTDDLSKAERQAVKRASRKAARKAAARKSFSKAIPAEAVTKEEAVLAAERERISAERERLLREAEEEVSAERERVLRDAEEEAQRILDDASARADELEAIAAQAASELEAAKTAELQAEKEATARRKEVCAYTFTHTLHLVSLLLSPSPRPPLDAC